MLYSAGPALYAPNVGFRHRLFLLHDRNIEADQADCLKLEGLFAPLRERVDLWHQGQLPAGGVISALVHQKLAEADVILLLCTGASLANQEWMELCERALTLRQVGRVEVVPVIVGPCVWWEYNPLKGLAPLPSNRKAVRSWPSTDDAWVEIVKGVISVLDKLPAALLATSPGPKPETAVWPVPVGVPPGRLQTESPADLARDLRLQHQQLLLWGIQLQQGNVDPRHASLLRGLALDRIRCCRTTLAGAGVIPHQGRRGWAAFQDAERALVGFIDWAGRSQMPEHWKLLQDELYGGEKLDELVTIQMEDLANDPLAADYPVEALEAQARCLDLGYCGGSASRRMDPRKVDGLKRKLAAALLRPLPELAPLLPEIQQRSRWRPRVGPRWILGTALILLALLGVGVRRSIHLRALYVREQIEQRLRSDFDDLY